MSEKIRDLWEQRKLLLKANYLEVKLNFLCERKPVNENSCGMDAHLILFGTRLHTNKPILIAWISIVFILGRNRFYYSKTDCLGWDLERRRISLDTYDFECKNFKCRIGRSYLQEQSLPLLFLEILWSCHGESRKWKFEKIVTLFVEGWLKKMFIIQNTLIDIVNQLLRITRLLRHFIGLIIKSP